MQQRKRHDALRREQAFWLQPRMRYVTAKRRQGIGRCVVCPARNDCQARPQGFAERHALQTLAHRNRPQGRDAIKQLVDPRFDGSQEHSEERRMPHRNQAEVRSLDETARRRRGPVVHVQQPRHVRRHGQGPAQCQPRRPTEVLCVVVESDRDAAGCAIGRAGDGRDRPVAPRTAKRGDSRVEVVQPGAGRGTKLAEQGVGVRHQLVRGRRAARALERANWRGRQDRWLTVGRASYPRFQILVGHDRHAALPLCHRRHAFEAVRPAVGGVSVAFHKRAQASGLRLLAHTHGALEAAPCRRETKPVRRMNDAQRKGLRHASLSRAINPPTIRRPASVRLLSSSEATETSSSPAE